MLSATEFSRLLGTNRLTLLAELIDDANRVLNQFAQRPGYRQRLDSLRAMLMSTAAQIGSNHWNECAVQVFNTILAIDAEINPGTRTPQYGRWHPTDATAFNPLPNFGASASRLHENAYEAFVEQQSAVRREILTRVSSHSERQPSSLLLSLFAILESAERVEGLKNGFVHRGDGHQNIYNNPTESVAFIVKERPDFSVRDSFEGISAQELNLDFWFIQTTTNQNEVFDAWRMENSRLEKFEYLPNWIGVLPTYRITFAQPQAIAPGYGGAVRAKAEEILRSGS